MARGSVSKINVMRRCKRRFWYQYILNLRAKIQSATPGKGSLGHAALEAYFAGKDWSEVINTYPIDMDNVFEEERQAWATMQGDVYKILKGYVTAFGPQDSQSKTLGIEVPFDVTLTSKTTGHKHQLTGRIDRIYSDAQGEWVEDHKFVKVIPEAGSVYMDSQLGVYLPVVKHLKLADPIGVSFNFLRTKLPSVPALLKSGSLSKAKSDTDYYTYLAEIKKHGLDPEDYVDILTDLREKSFYKRIRFPMNEKTVQRILAEVVMSLDDIQAMEDQGQKADGCSPRTLIKNNCEWSCPYYKLCMTELAGTPSEGFIAEHYVDNSKPVEEDEEETE